ncbi:hypothetical protein [Legionella worsleiensis]|uniref:Uncharacterized protein n=1 Tax=Legionella worsleiensis TaxID=45076 RepID=A0A0W1AA24_9GAMM|nr:hypothetical protein [Legionella worsleiensis]KTD78207.1 hypothetical protein Lwor_1602 [Legionella worsleiensis]STY32544.1 Uncharacterised protein [Legionella worsleiensis]
MAFPFLTRLNVIKPLVEQAKRGYSNIATQIMNNPMDYYSELRRRIKRDGALAGFPEFKESVETLQETLCSSEVKQIVKTNPSLSSLYYLTQNTLFHLTLNYKTVGDNYPHIPPVKSPYPYLPTILGIERGLEFIDNCVRLTYTDIPDFYHVKRYGYQMFSSYNCNLDSSIIYFPTIEPLSLEHFTKTRQVPIGFMGVSIPATFADAYYLSPLELYHHDSNHNRRIKSYNDLFIQDEQCTADEAYEQFNQFVENIVKPTTFCDKQIAKHEMYVRQLMEVLYFELFREYAIAPCKKQIIDAFLHEPDGLESFEHMIDDSFQSDQFDSLRLDNNNIQSGLNLDQLAQINRRAIQVRYFFNKGPNFITSAYNKLINNYYHGFDVHPKNLPPINEITPSLMASAACRILNDVNGSHLLNHQNLLNLVTAPGLLPKYPGFFTKHPQRIVRDEENSLTNKPNI